MKTHLFLLLLAIISYVDACGTCDSVSVGNPQQMYDNIGYPSYPSSKAPVSQAEYVTPGGSYNTHLSPATNYPVYQESSSYYHGAIPTTYVYAESSASKKGLYPTLVQYSSSESSYIAYPPEPTPVGTPPTPVYYETTTLAYVSPTYSSSYTTSTSTAYATTNSYTSSSVQSSPTTVTLPIQTSSASCMKGFTMITWAWAVAIGGVGICMGLHLQF
jgi:hypothetical protein